MGRGQSHGVLRTCLRYPIWIGLMESVTAWMTTGSVARNIFFTVYYSHNDILVGECISASLRSLSPTPLSQSPYLIPEKPFMLCAP